MKKYFILLLTLISLSWICSADLAWFTFDSYTAEYKLKELWNLEVSENINVDFSERRHWIYRNIPYKYSNYMATPIENISVPWYNYTTSTQGNYLVIQVWDANETVLWKQYYSLDYTIKWTVRDFSWYQELYWNVLWTEWNTDVNNFSFKIELPYEIELSTGDIYTYSWKRWSRDSIEYKIEWKTISNVEPLNFWPHEWLTISIKLPQNYITVKNYRSNDFYYLWGFIWVLWVLWCWITAYLFRNVFKRFNNKELNALKESHWRKIRDVIHYDPPEWYTPAEVAAIYTWSSDYSILSAFIYSWIKDWYIKLEEWEWIPWLFKMKKNFLFKKTDKIPVFHYDAKHAGKDYCWLVDPEWTFRDMCFVSADINDLSRLDTSDTNTFKSIVDEVYYRIITSFIPKRKELYKFKEPSFKNSWTSAIFYNNIKSDPPKTFKFSNSMLWLARMVILLIILFLVLWQIALYMMMVFCVLVWMYWIYDALCSLAAFWTTNGRKPLNIFKKRRNRYDIDFISEEWISVIEHVLWFRKYLLAVENEKLKTLLSEDPSYFEKILPYAIALDIWDHWVKKCVKILDEIDYKVNWADIDSIRDINYNVWDNISSVVYWIDHPYSGGSSDSDRWSSSWSDWGGYSWWWWGWGWWWSW